MTFRSEVVGQMTGDIRQTWHVSGQSGEMILTGIINLGGLVRTSGFAAQSISGPAPNGFETRIKALLGQ